MSTPLLCSSSHSPLEDCLYKEPSGGCGQQDRISPCTTALVPGYCQLPGAGSVVLSGVTAR